MLSYDRRLPHDTWIHLDYRKTFLVSNFLHLIRPEIIIKEFIILRHQVLQDWFQCILVQGTLVARDEQRLWGTIPMTALARRPSTMSSLLPVEISQNSTVGQQRQQKKGASVRLILQSTIVLKSSQSIAGKNFQKIEIFDARIASALSRIIQILTSRRRLVSRNRMPRKRSGFCEEDRSLS